MGNFTNTTMKNTIDSITEGFKERLKNPYYLFTDKKPTPVTYYNQNINKSTLDEGSKLAYSMIGKESPIRLNKINNTYLYGMDKVIVQLDNGDFGLESESIEGDDLLVLPNTIIPIANDFFSIDYLDKKLLFKVTSVTQDTLENGANFYKLSYKLDQLTDTVVEAQVTDEFNMIINNVGTQFNTIVRSKEYDYIEYVEDITSRLKKYYMNLFYSDRVQTFILPMDGYNFYDPYLIEFLIRNNILSNNEDYLYITHQTYMNATFAIDYDMSFFRAVELGEFKTKYRYTSTATLIDDVLSLLSSRIEDYYQMDYRPNKSPFLKVIFNIEQDIIDRILSNNIYTFESYMNIVIKYFNKQDINIDNIKSIEEIDYSINKELFYFIPIIIYILESKVKQILKN